MQFEYIAASDEKARECSSQVLRQGCTQALAVRKSIGIFLQTSSDDDIKCISMKVFVRNCSNMTQALVIKPY